MADGGYSSGEALAYLATTKIDAWIPNFGQYKPHREGFIYDREADKYLYQQGKELPFRKEALTAKGDSYKVVPQQ